MTSKPIAVLTVTGPESEVRAAGELLDVEGILDVRSLESLENGSLPDLPPDEEIHKHVELWSSPPPCKLPLAATRRLSRFFRDSKFVLRVNREDGYAYHITRGEVTKKPLSE